MSLPSQARSARASTCAALYQCRLFAFTLPTTTLFLSTMAAATSAVKPVARPPLPTPVRQTTPPHEATSRQSAMTWPTPVHSTITSGLKPTSVGRPEWYVAPRARTSSGLEPDTARSNTCTSRPCCRQTSAASRPMGPAPVTSTLLGSQKARCPTACTCSQALVTTVVGSSSTPRRPSERSTFMAYSGSIRHLSDMKPSICLMPRSVYWPLRHMSHSPTAQLGQGTGSGRRTIPATRSPFCRPPVGPGSSTRPSDSCPSTNRVLPGGAHPYLPSIISTSVPQTPTATASTITDPSRTSGAGMSSRRTLSGLCRSESVV